MQPEKITPHGRKPFGSAHTCYGLLSVFDAEDEIYDFDGTHRVAGLHGFTAGGLLELYHSAPYPTGDREQARAEQKRLLDEVRRDGWAEIGRVGPEWLGRSYWARKIGGGARDSTATSSTNRDAGERVTAALREIGEERFAAFIRHLGGRSGCVAVKKMNRALDAGRRPASVLLAPESGFRLDVSRLTPNQFRVQFGFQAGPLLGDGGTWDVRFETGGDVLDVRVGTLWVS